MQRKVYIATALVITLLLVFQHADAGKIRKRKIRKLFKHSLIFNDHFTGFALYDLDVKKTIYELNADKYFTPASNTKLFTFYTSKRMLGDSIPALRYVVKGDSLIFWGTGDPSFLHRDLKGNNAYKFLKSSGKKLFYAAGNYKNAFYGAGWAWDDYNDDYQAEISGLPIENNTALFYADKNDSLQVEPAYLKKFIRCDTLYRPAKFGIRRDFLSNSFIYPFMPLPKNFRQEVPWKTDDKLAVQLLQDTLKLPVSIIRMETPPDAKVIYNANADTVYKHMLQPSDNFIAEQLLLVCSSTKFKTLSTDSVINYAKANFLNDLPDKPQWVDGSGLSRYNLFTPRSIVSLLCKILDEFKNDDLVHSLMPAGGVSGTIRKAYKTDNGQPFVWVKTGSLSNNYNQSGYIITKKGKRLAFSFMNNNTVTPLAQVRDEMVRIVTFIHDNY